AAADLFVFGSTTETQGLVIAEARAAGTPSVVVNAGGAHETVQDGKDGLVVAPEVEAFTAALRVLLRYEERRAAMRAACLSSAPYYTPTAMAERVQAVYERALQHHSPEHASANGRK